MEWRPAVGLLLAVVAACCLVHAAWPMDPAKADGPYMRDQWDSSRSFPGGQVYAIAQTPDGNLWIGSENGLVRFDGLNFKLFDHTNTPSLLSGPILGLAVDSEGGLLIRQEGPNLERYLAGKMEQLLADRRGVDWGVTAMCRGNRSQILISTLGNGILSYQKGELRSIAPAPERPNFLVISMAEADDGRLLMGTRDAGLFVLDGGKISPFEKEPSDRKINCLLRIGNGELWVGTDNGIALWEKRELTQRGLPSALNHIQALSMAIDRESNVWIGTPSGLLRVNGGVVSSVEQGGPVTALFEDREENLWAGSDRGIERIRTGVFTTYSTREGLPSDSNGPVYADPQGRIWFAPLSGGLYWLKDGRVGKVTEAGIGNDVVYSITGREGEVWVGRQRGGLTRLEYKDGRLVAETYTEAQGLAQNSVFSLCPARHGSMWAGTLSGGLSQFKDGRFRTYTTANGLASNTINSVLEGQDGSLWAATPNGLSVMSKGVWQTFTERDGLPSNDVNCLLQEQNRVMWIGTAGGIAFGDSEGVHGPPQTPDSLRGSILGLAEDRGGWLWIATASHVLRVRRDHLLYGTLEDSDVREFDRADGLLGSQGVKRDRSLVADEQGRIWISLSRGLSVADPVRAMHSVPAMVSILAISADGSPIELRGPVRIPASDRRIMFTFAGVSLDVPERVKYRYKLDGFDRGWSEPTSVGEAMYTNLSPGRYNFRVIASNSDGLWNSSEAVVPFEIDPLFWQTWWFRVLALLVVAGGALALYRFRLHQLTRQLNVRFEERLSERTRIAQDLHDTLLQGLLSTSMQLHVVVDRLPAGSPANQPLKRVLQLMGQVIEEGRNAVRGLRSNAASASFDLEQAFSRIQQELTVQDRTGFRVVVQGRPRALHPVIRDEVYRIGREALVNAFRHSHAKSIEVEVEYAARLLRVLVRDNGCGIDSQVLKSGRDGHWGLPGMRERAETIGARLKVWSRAGAGTEVELSVPSHVAFQSQSSSRLLKWLVGLHPRKETSGTGEPGGK